MSQQADENVSDLIATQATFCVEPLGNSPDGPHEPEYGQLGIAWCDGPVSNAILKHLAQLQIELAAPCGDLLLIRGRHGRKIVQDRRRPHFVGQQ